MALFSFSNFDIMLLNNFAVSNFWGFDFWRDFVCHNNGWKDTKRSGFCEDRWYYLTFFVLSSDDDRSRSFLIGWSPGTMDVRTVSVCDDDGLRTGAHIRQALARESRAQSLVGEIRLCVRKKPAKPSHNGRREDDKKEQKKKKTVRKVFTSTLVTSAGQREFYISYVYQK